MVSGDDEDREMNRVLGPRTPIAAFAGLALILLTASTAAAGASGNMNKDGVDTSVTQVVVDRANKGLDLQTGKPDTRFFEYTSTTACPQSFPGSPGANDSCGPAVQACAGNTPAQGLGPQLRVYRREVDGKRVAIGPWEQIGTTCLADRVPGKSALMDLILAAFHHTAWAKPTVHMQPEGNVTLVTLPTYFEVTWPVLGFQPGEIDSTSLLSSQVRIRPTVHDYTYLFGDGTSFGPTESPGGTYPDGDVTHAYAKAGSYSSRIDITYGGEYSIGGGAWTSINATALVTGEAFPVTVKTANARLVIK